jgi:CBS domain containing-hemolysin-like protein
MDQSLLNHRNCSRFGASRGTFCWTDFGVSIESLSFRGTATTREFANIVIYSFMGQDKVYLQVLRISGTEREKRDASKVLRVLRHGKHWILVTLLVSNVITNETLPIVLDHWLSSGWPAILTSTILVLLFGEIIPQSVCAKYGLRIGANTST